MKTQIRFLLNVEGTVWHKRICKVVLFLRDIINYPASDFGVKFSKSLKIAHYWDDIHIGSITPLINFADGGAV